MKKTILAVFAASLLIVSLAGVFAAGGFDQFGYNYQARVFVGTGSSWCLAGGQAADCLGMYSNDQIVMKWNAAWDSCNANGYDNPAYCLGAWVNNEWNGMGPNGSSWTENTKIIWVGSAGENSPYWLPGGYSIWGNYEVIMDHGMSPDGFWSSTATVPGAIPNGYGAVNAQ